MTRLGDEARVAGSTYSPGMNRRGLGVPAAVNGPFRCHDAHFSFPVNLAYDADRERICNSRRAGDFKASMTWDHPHWSGRPQNSAVPRQRLRPNLYARIARFCAAHGSILVLFYAVLAMVCGTYAASILRIDPDQRPRITLDDGPRQPAGRLDRQFPGIEQTFLALSDSDDPDAARRAGDGACRRTERPR